MVALGREIAARFERWARRMAWTLVVGGAALLLVWWAGAADVLATDGRPPLRPGAAVCYALLGTALLAAHRPRLRRACAGVAGLLTLVAVAEVVSSGRLGVDAFMNASLREYTTHPVQAAPLPTFSLAALTLAVLFFDEWEERLVQALSLVVAGAGLLSFVEWLYLADEGRWPMLSTSPLSAIGLMLAGSAALAARPSRGFMALVTAPGFSGSLIRRRIPPMLVIPIVTGWLFDLSVGRGLLDRGFALAFFTLGTASLMVLLVWRTAVSEAAAERLRLKNRAELEAREQELGLTLHSIGDALIASDLDGRITRMNPVAEQLTGWSLSEAQGRPLLDIFRIGSPEAQDSAERELGTTRLQARDGREIVVTERRTQIRDGQGVPRGQVVVFRDAREVLVVHRALAAQARKKEILAESSRLFSEAGHEVPVLASVIARRLGEIFGGLCLLRFFSKDTAWVLFEESAVFHPDPAIARLFTEQGLPPRSVEEPGLVHDVLLRGSAERHGEDLRRMVEQLRPGVGALMDKAKLESAIGLPIRSRDRLIGSVIVARGGGAWSADDRAMAEEIVLRAGVVLDNALLLRDLGRQLRELDQANARFAALVESAPDAIVMVDTSGTIAIANGEAESMFGYGRAELLGMKVDELIPERYRRGHAGMRAGYAANPHVRHAMAQGQELFGRRKDGSEFAAEISLSPVEAPAGRHIAAVIRDVTDRKRVEELRHRAQELEVETRRAIEASRLKSEFLANMSHELRTPLNAIIGFTALMEAGKAGPLSGPQKEYLGDVLTSARHLLQLINDVIELSKIEAGKIEPRPEATDPSRVAREVRDVLKGVANAGQIHVEVHVDPGLDVVVVDPRLFKQVLYHFLASTLGLALEGSRVSLRVLLVDEAWFRVEAHSGGPEIKQQDLDRVFAEFQQLDVDVSRKFISTGLGLALAKRIVEAHGGTVAVQSAKGAGTTLSAQLLRRPRS